MADKCFEGWKSEDGNSSGRCCCNCEHQANIYRHPWNTMVGGRMKGPITQIAGYGCRAVHESNSALVFMEDQHGMCEAHEWKVKENS